MGKLLIYSKLSAFIITFMTGSGPAGGEGTAGIAMREPKWQKYHREVHTLSVDLAEIAKKAQPKLLVTYHRIYHMEIQDNTKDLDAEMAFRCDAILREIKDVGYDGKVVNGQDLDVFE